MCIGTVVVKLQLEIVSATGVPDNPCVMRIFANAAAFENGVAARSFLKVRPSGSFREPPMREIAVVVVAGLSFVLLGTLGGAISKLHFLMPGYIMGPKMELLPLIYWLSWSCTIVGRFCGDFTCGVLLGRFLRRTNPVYVLIGFMIFPLALMIRTVRTANIWTFIPMNSTPI